MNTILEPGDELVVLMPSYQPHYAIAQALNCQVKPWILRAEREFALDLEELVRLLTPRTRAVVVCFPNNPTGASLDITTLKALTDIVAKVGAFLVWDGAFSELVYDGSPLPDPIHWYERTISFGTLSKAYGLPGLRIGWCLASPTLLENCVRLRDYITVTLSPLMEYIAQRAVQRKNCLLQPRLQQAHTNLKILETWAQEHQDIIHWVRPKGGVVAFLRLYNTAVESFCHQLAQDYGLFVLPGGSCFGCPEYIRLGFGGSTIILQEGLARLSRKLSTLKR